MRALRKTIAAGALLGACALTPARVERMAQRGDVPGLEQAWAQADSAAVRQAVLVGLGRVPDSASARALLVREAEHNPDRALRLLALQSLESHQGPEVAAALVRALEDPWAPLRDQAQNDLYRRKEQVQQPLLEAARAAPHALVRAAALRILVRHATVNEALRPPLGGILAQAARADDAALVRAEAVAGLGLLGLRAERALVAELLRGDADPAVRQAARRALEKLGTATAAQVVVAVLPLQTAPDPEAAQLGAQLTEYVAARLSGAKVCEVVDPQKMAAALDELRKMGKQVYDGDAPNVPELGRFKIANQLVYGSVQKENSVYTVVLNRLDVSTLALVPGAAVTVKGYRGELDQLKEEAAQKLIENFR